MSVSNLKLNSMRIIASSLIGLIYLGLVSPSAHAQEKQPKAMFILDGSGSMWGKITDGHKILLARRAIAKAIRPYDEKISLGLVAYGHRKRGACKDIQLLQKPAPLNAIQMTRLVNNINPLGKTPITGAIQQAIKPLDKKGGSIILLTDGPENCRQNPCELISKNFAKQNNITIHVIAFAMQAKEARTLACLAKNSGGQFLTPNSFKELNTALATSLSASFKGLRNKIPSKTPTAKVRTKPLLELSAHLGPSSPALQNALDWQVIKLDSNNNPEKNLPPWVSKIAQTKFDLNVGTYRVTANYKNFAATKDIALKKGEQRSEKLVFNLSELELPAGWAAPDSRSGFGKLLLHTPQSPGQKAATTVIQLSKRAEKRLIKSGAYKISAVEGGEMRTWFIHASPGQTISLPLWSNMGRVRFNLLQADKKSLLSKPLLRIFKDTSKTEKQEVARSASTSPQFDLPAGRYLARLQEGFATLEQPFTVNKQQQTVKTLALARASLKIEIKDEAAADKPNLEITAITPEKKSIQLAKITSLNEDILLSPGRYRLALRFGPAALPLVKTLTLKAGEKKSIKFSPATTKINFKISNRDDPVSRHQIFWQLYKNKGPLLWQSVQANPTLALSKGHYRLRAELGEDVYETRFRINGSTPRTIDLANKLKTKSKTN